MESLARVLQLDANERAYLFVLALRQSPPVETFVPPTISPTLRQFLDQMGTTPTCVADARLNVVAGNAAYCAVFGGDPATVPERECNLIWRLFMSLGARHANAEWAELARVYLAQFRAEYGRFINDPWWGELIAELNEGSPIFRELWARHDVLNVSEGQKKFHHPLAGELIFDFLWLRTVDSGDLRLLIHTPRSQSGTAEKIARLLAAAAEAKPQNP